MFGLLDSDEASLAVPKRNIGWLVSDWQV